MTFEQAIRYWFGRVNYEQRSPNPSDLKLDRMRALLARLGHPEQRLRIVHVAGSKGKGSTSALLDSILRHAGYRTGLFTSPHLSRVEERIQIDGAPISADELTALIEDVRPAVEEMDRRKAPDAIGVTFFEIATALGLLHFVRRRVEVAVLEVGLGGRFDSTNVCQPLVAVLTSISYDHMEQLGNTLTRIAFEKAGIVKPSRPTVSGVRAPEARMVIERICRERGAPLRQLDVDFHYTHEPGLITAEAQRLPRVRVVTNRRAWPAMELGLLGEHQAANAAVAVATIEHLHDSGLHISEQAVAAGLAKVNWPARMEVLGRRPLVVLDCAHNLASVQALLDTLRESFPLHSSGSGDEAPRRLLVFAGSGDKDLPGMLELLAPHFDHIYLTRFASPRAVPPERLAELLRAASDLPYTLCASPAEAWESARAAAGPADRICVAGSVFLAGELRPLLVESEGRAAVRTGSG
ncbi:MAG: bifunctional folylpolyglutamate synthase/dihydrofolate synthase [Gemmataceae bacterium]|nr:bifunctional folylpolyglutamate synthase/dihydrofolate synthase [Gemmataceae bacterium]